MDYNPWINTLISLSLSLSLFVLRQFSSLARVRRFPISAMLPQRTILGRLFPQTPLFYRVLYFLLPSLNRSPYPPLPLHYQPPACRYHVPFMLSLQVPKPPLPTPLHPNIPSNRHFYSLPSMTPHTSISPSSSPSCPIAACPPSSSPTFRSHISTPSARTPYKSSPSASEKPPSSSK